jgi:SagB-type dehydrogenase family enzyme
LRANPSSGNLHPTEGYAVLPALDGIHDGPALHHYAPKEHGLERRADLEPEWWSGVTATIPAHSFVVGLSSILWREAWKYGERAYRYCQHDVGHALGTLRFAAAALGWKLALLEGSNVTAQLLGLDRDADYAGAEREHPDLLAVVSPTRSGEHGPLFEALSRPAGVSRWCGKANRLSRDHVAWPVIDEVAAATLSPLAAIDEDLATFPSEAELFEPPIRSGTNSAEKVILGRRSAVSMDGSTAISAAKLFQMLGRVVSTRDRRALPWDAIPWRPRIHLGLFVHRVNGLASGLYALVRDPEQVGPLCKAMRCDFLWQRPAACPSGLPLYLLQKGDCRELAARVSCGQDIAGDGAFSLGMIADYMGSLARHGAAFYRNLFWEAGLVGQVLYLEAEEAGVRATGIGCYFDDPVHEVFGLDSRDWQSLYHFTVGGPVDDTRITTLPAYDWGTA